MNCFKYSFSSNDAVNGMCRLNAQQNHELTNLLNNGVRYKLIVSKFINLATEFDDTNAIDSYYVTVSFNNINFVNSYNIDSIDNIVVRTIGSLTSNGVDKYILTCNYENGNIQDNNVGMYSNDRIIEQGNLSVNVLYYDPLTGNIVQPNSSIWLLEFFVIFD